MKEPKISNIQLGLLTVGFLYGSTAIRNAAMAAKRDAWIALIFGWIGGILLITMYLYISKLNPNKTLAEILERCFGKMIGKAVCILYIWHFLHLSAMNSRAFGEFMAIVSYPDTPLIVLVSINMLVIVYAARKGLETIGRMSEILVPLIPVAILLVSISIIQVSDFNAFKPVFQEHTPVIKGTLGIMTFPFGDYVAFLMIIPYTNREKGRFKAAYMGAAAVGILFMIIIIRNTIVLGPSVNEHLMYPMHAAAQLIPGMSVEPLVDINLLIGGGFKIALQLYAATKAIAEVFGIEEYKPLIPAFAVFTIVLSIWLYPNVLEAARWGGSIYDIYYGLPFELVFPVLMLVISAWKMRKNKAYVNR